ncbi:UDP-N-acetylmuramoyl-L-alanyl-D-glutamate--2,6-diaminopimelate ligase [Halobacillus sp. BAB-2008]|uniref:UDP-N-acetylmuramoyl-L-alanyl-D-glutamate--2, 6-diaminopimelate ligase n=1 Tax=Halobacillus sp. BAB-2008 TaxID=1246484 RepID=UPI0002F4DD71|nr:UDP-N-acetylmuramoyl-L-alanyl-D-glutamate--2,6-diaminopimelate ligase [Halobacillus sp. BAB-2008]
MRVQTLIQYTSIQAPLNMEEQRSMVKGVTADSRAMEEGYVFVAVPGYNSDGHAFISNAIEKGAVLVVGEKPLEGLPVPYIQVDNSRKFLGQAAAAFYGYPAEKKTVIGVTGTNGKTTTSHILKHICEQNGYTCSLFGTIDNIVNGETLPADQTTPDAPTIQKLLAESEDDLIIMEVSSHGLEQYRLEGISFDYAVFTNLTHDHLDYHRTMEEYFQAKSKLFTMLKKNGAAIINTDDPWGSKLASCFEDKPLKTIGQDQGCSLKMESLLPASSMVLLREENQHVVLPSPLEGEHNLYNTAQAYAVAKSLDIPTDAVLESLQQFEGIKGRFEVIRTDFDVTIVIDYAHTADSISHTLQAVRAQGASSICHVFGFRGNRDVSKREKMLLASLKHADRTVLTMDDLNGVSVSEMKEEVIMVQETFAGDRGTFVSDRTIAIENAVLEADSGTWVVITGKGHETYQQDFCYSVHSDREAVDYILEKRKIRV